VCGDPLTDTVYELHVRIHDLAERATRHPRPRPVSSQERLEMDEENED
jgi:hypothetical protein